MASWKEFLVAEGYDKIEKAKKLTEVSSKDDPEEEPYKSMYEARNDLQEVREKLKNFAENESFSDEEVTFVLAALELRLGVNYADTEERSAGEEHINRCLTAVEKYKLDPRGMNIYHEALNQMGILWTGRHNPTKALDYFQKAEDLYLEFKDLVGGAPRTTEEFLQAPSDDADKMEHKRSAQLESTYTHTLFYFAQVHGQLDNREQSARYCHVTLQRQLDAPDLAPLDWCLQAATLSQYYMIERDFTMSRHCLASSEVVLQQAEANAEEQGKEYKEKLVHARADLQRCWAKYGIGLLESSKEKLLHEVEMMDENGEKAAEKSKASGESNEHGGDSDKDGKRFNLEVSAHEGKVTDQPLNVLDEAREVFLDIQKRLTSAKELYTLDEHCRDYIEITQDHSLAFKFLAFFELDMAVQCKMHKRRIDMLSALLKELNIQHYLLSCRQLMFEIADTYSTMLDLKLAILESSGARPTAHSIKKINTLTRESIQKYREYLDTLKGGQADYPDEFPDNDVRPGLIAMFCMGRLNSKFIVMDVQPRLANIKKSIECYQFVVDYCKRNPDSLDLVKAEHEICVEMVGLLPVKMEKIRQQYEV